MQQKKYLYIEYYHDIINFEEKKSLLSHFQSKFWIFSYDFVWLEYIKGTNNNLLNNKQLLLHLNGNAITEL